MALASLSRTVGPMSGSNDNVIQFPGGSDPREVARRLANELFEQGHDPAALVQQLLQAGSRFGEVLPVRQQPSLAEPRADVAVFRVRFDLDHVRPPVWRRLELTSDLTLAELHEILQAALGWTDSHLHHFQAGPKRDHRVLPFLNDWDEEEGEEGTHERDVRLDQVLDGPGDRLFYEYDFGDGWEHTIRLEEVTPYDGSGPRARVTGGRRACPPEDCGGVGGYEDILQALADPTSATGHQRELLDWLPEDYDPDDFSVEGADEWVQVALEASGGHAAVASQLATGGLGFDPSLRELVDLSTRTPKPLDGLIAAAGLTETSEPDPATRARMVRPWLHLLDVLGPEGVKLTAAGWLPPALVTRLATDLDLLEPWMGKGNREELTPQVLIIRESAVAMGLLRKVKGRLVPTRTGHRIADDADALWQHLVASLPLGRKDHDRHAGTVMLLTVAAGETPYRGICSFGPQLLWHAGWSDAGRPLFDEQAIHLARPTWDALQVTGAGVGRDETVTDAARQLARAALRTPI
jgi:hypothetical protein